MYYIEQMMWNLRVVAKYPKPLLYPRVIKAVSIEHNKKPDHA